MKPIYDAEKTANDSMYSFKRLGESNKDWFKLTIGEGDETESFKLKTGVDVTDMALESQLNKMATGDSSVKPSGFDDGKNPLVVYKNTMYVYVGGKWKQVDSRKGNVEDAVNAYLKNGRYDFNKQVIETNGKVVDGAGFGAR